MAIFQAARLGDEGVDKVGSVTLSSNAGTLNRRCGIITSEALTTAAGVAVNFVLTNSEVAVGDAVLATRNGGTSNEGTPEMLNAVVTASTITFIIENRHASAALDGTLIIAYQVIKAGG